MIRYGAALLCLLLSLACGASSGPAARPMPLRAHTAGQSLLALAPLGADLLLELNLERLRTNSAVGSLLTTVSPPDATETVNLLQQAEVALVLVYDVGSSPRQLVIMRASADALPGAIALGDKVFAVGDAELLARAAGIQGPKESMLADAELLRLRDEVMPPTARDATLRLSLRLDFDARVAIASKIAISDVPISVAVWGDVVDDMAFIAHLGSDEAEDAPRLTRAILGFRKRVAAHVFARSLGLSAPIRDARVTAIHRRVKVVLLLGPKRLQYVVARLLKHLSNSQPSDPQSSNSQPSNPQSSNSQPSNSQPSNSQPSNSQPSNFQSSNLLPSNPQSSNSQPSNFQSSNLLPSNPQSSNSQPSNPQSSNFQFSNLQS